MILKNNKEVGFIYKNNQNIDKVLNNGNLIFEQGFTRETSGVPPITLPTLSTGKNLKNYRIYGNSIQDGTPTPSSPVEIESVGDKSKNLFDGNISFGNLDSNNGQPSGSNQKYIRIDNYIDVENFVYLTWTIKANRYSQSYVLFYDDGYSLIIRYNIRGVSGSILYEEGLSGTYTFGQYKVTVPSNAKYFKCFIYHPTNYDSLSDIEYMQVEKGRTATDYIPYNKYKIPISVSSVANKNLFWLKDAVNVSSLNQIYNCSNQTFTKEITNLVGMTYIISNAAFSQICYCEPLQSGKTYIWKFHNAKLLSTGHYLVLTYEDNTTESWHENTPITLTKNATITAIRQAYRDYTKGETESFQIQVEEGSVATDYKPYYPPVNIYLDEPLRKIGDYTDYIDFENQKIIRTIEEKIITGTEAWSDVSRSSNKYYRFNIGNYGYVIPSQGLCNNYMQDSIVSTTTTVGFNVFNVTSLKKSVIAIRPENVANYTVETFKQYLADKYNNGRPIIVYYPLATPKEESITLPTIPSIKGTTIYSVGTNIQPSNMYIKYKGR